MKKFITVLTLIAGGAAIAGAVLQRTGKLQNIRPRRFYKVRRFGKKDRPAAIFVSGKIPPDTIPERLRDTGSEIWARGTRYLSRHKIGA